MNTNDCGAKMPQPKRSVLENEIESLRSEVGRLNRLSDNISNMLMSSPPCGCGADKNPVNTVAGSLNEILTIAEQTGSNLERVARCLDEQLGGLKL